LLLHHRDGLVDHLLDVLGHHLLLGDPTPAPAAGTHPGAAGAHPAGPVRPARAHPGAARPARAGARVGAAVAALLAEQLAAESRDVGRDHPEEGHYCRRHETRLDPPTAHRVTPTVPGSRTPPPP